MPLVLDPPEPDFPRLPPPSPLLPLRLSRLCELLAIERDRVGCRAEADALRGEAAAWRVVGGITHPEGPIRLRVRAGMRSAPCNEEQT